MRRISQKRRIRVNPNADDSSGYSRIANESVRLKLTRQAEGVIAEINWVGISRHRVKQNVEF